MPAPLALASFSAAAGAFNDTLDPSGTSVVVTIEATDASTADAGADPGTFTVWRSGATTSSLTVSYAVSGSATPGLDYTALPGRLTIPAGSAEGGRRS